MSNRLSKIYTRSGDQGQTGLANGERVSKTDLRIEVIGTVDELNSAIGIVIAILPSDESITKLLRTIQHQLFDLGGELAIADPSYVVITPTEIEYLEEQLDLLNSEVPPLKEFILPGGTLSASYTHLARSICRRAERRIIALLQDESAQVNPNSGIYLNRLSDLLFVASRIIVLRQGGEEILWRSKEVR
ncbi:cob(I)yrinic acid a,c-diamide adenosyltransferase [Neptuniibacter sp. QD48_11]|uniref:cob(I)yrinic acid a,c-diamide adenosyltransferase n=1 Tax=Neptuniibacter sp. QD48_11 TaxID=3398211 RepID=UPI0039F4FAFB